MKQPTTFVQTIGTRLVPGLALAVFLAEPTEAATSDAYNAVLDDTQDFCAGRAAGLGLPSWYVSEPFINLWIQQGVVRYTTSGGKMVTLDAAFRQRGAINDTNIFGLGPNWQCSWLSTIAYEVDKNEPPLTGWYLQNVNSFTPPMGGSLYYDPDGAAPEYNTFSRLSHGSVQGTPTSCHYLTFTVTYPDGSVAHYDDHLCPNCPYECTITNYLSTVTDPQGRTITFNYTNSNNLLLLTSVVDNDNRTNRIYYDPTFPNQISAVVDPYLRTNRFQYDNQRRLTNLINAAGMSCSFVYDPQGVITNMITCYGTNLFKYTVNTNTGNVITRSMEVTEPDGAKSLYLYRRQSTKLSTNSSVDLLPCSYSTNELPNTAPFTNTFDNTWMDARNSFHWTPRCYAQLSTNFTLAGDFNSLTLNDYNLASIGHWLIRTNNINTVANTLSLLRGPSPDGAAAGQKMWFDYGGKIGISGTNCSGQTATNYYAIGANSAPLIKAYLLSDGSTRFTYSRNNSGGHPTNMVETYSGAAGVALRTNTFIYGNGVDLVAAFAASGELVSSNIYNGVHQMITNFNALGEKTVYFYQSTSPYLLLGSIAPNGRASTNYYYTSGYVNFLQSRVIPAFGITNSFTYTNALVYTATDERGLTVTNTYDVLQRVLTSSRSDGTTRAVYTNFSLLYSVDRLGDSNFFGYDSYGRKIWDADALGRTNRYAYASWGGLQSATNALGQFSTTYYDNLGQVVATVNMDGRGATNQYDSVGQLISSSDPAGVSSTNYYNNQGLLFAVSNVFGLVRFAQYDVRDRPTNSVDANGISVATTYDILGRVLTQVYPDGTGVTNGYTANIAAATSVTNQLGKVTSFGYDLVGRLLATTNANQEVIRQTFGISGELLNIVDSANHTNTWSYDLYGRQTSKTNANGLRTVFVQYDPLGRITNRWTAAKSNTVYTYDAVGNLLIVTHASSPAVTNYYDALNRVTNRLDAFGATAYTFDNVGNLQSEDGPWPDDAITYAYTTNYLLQSLSVAQPSGSPWTQSYGYDAASRRTNVTSAAGAFGCEYYSGLNGFTSDCSLVKRILLPNGCSVTNSVDPMARLLATKLLNAQSAILDSHTYSYDRGSRLTNTIRFDSSSAAYGYDDIGQLTSAKATDPGNITRLHEQLGYLYDAAHNLAFKTNNALVQTFNLDAVNQLTTITRNTTNALTVSGTTTTAATNVIVNGLTASLYGDWTFAKDGFTITNGSNTFTATARDANGGSDTNTITVNLPATNNFSYDLNGNLLSDGQRGYDYDDENQLIRITATNAWKSEFVYDGLGQRRIRIEYSWQSGAWQTNSITRYICIRGLVIQERDGNNTPLAAYTRTSGAGGGIGGLLARTDQTTQTHCYYHSDGSGNVTAIVNSSQLIVARYLYDPYGNTLSASGPMAAVNTYCYASKELHAASGLVSFGFRFYNPSLQRWVNADPIQESGGLNLFAYVGNSPLGALDAWGLAQREHDDIGGNFSLLYFNPRTGLVWGMGERFFGVDVSLPQNVSAIVLQNSLMGSGFTMADALKDPRIGRLAEEISPEGLDALSSESVTGESGGYYTVGYTDYSTGGGGSGTESDPYQMPSTTVTAFSQRGAAISYMLTHPGSTYQGFQSAYTTLERPNDPSFGDGYTGALIDTALYAIPAAKATGGAVGLAFGILRSETARAGGTALAETVAADAGNHIVLGLEKYGLKETAAQVGGRTLMGEANWQSTLQAALGNANTRITVSLDGAGGATPYAQFMNAASAGMAPGASPFNWEMAQIYQAGRQASVTFMQGGQIIPNPFH